VPGSSPEGASCDEGVAWGFDAHFDTQYPRPTSIFYLTFTPPSDTVHRSACGDLAFTEDSTASNPARLVIKYTPWPLERTLYQFMVRRMREAKSSLVYDTTAEVPYSSSAVTKSDTVAAPAAIGYDLTFWELIWDDHTDSASNFPPPNYFESHGGFQLWKTINQPSAFYTDTLSINRPRAHWTNHHSGRTVDSTEVYRRVNGGGWQWRATQNQDSTSFTDTAVANGVYGYFVRHVSAPAPNKSGYGALAALASASTSADSEIINATPPAPTALTCEGNFSPTVDCAWQNTSALSHTIVFRDGAAKDTVAPGVSTWTDDTVETGASYQYKVRHLNGTVTGSYSNVVTGVALPVPPENLSCGGTSTSTATCVWINKESDTTEVWRRRGTKPTWTLVATLVPGVSQFNDSGLDNGITYTYRARHKRGSQVTAWSNEDPATPGSVPEPYRPVRP